MLLCGGSHTRTHARTHRTLQATPPRMPMTTRSWTCRTAPRPRASRASSRTARTRPPSSSPTSASTAPSWSPPPSLACPPRSPSSLRPRDSTSAAASRPPTLRAPACAVCFPRAPPLAPHARAPAPSLPRTLTNPHTTRTISRAFALWNHLLALQVSALSRPLAPHSPFLAPVQRRRAAWSWRAAAARRLRSLSLSLSLFLSLPASTRAPTYPHISPTRPRSLLDCRRHWRCVSSSARLCARPLRPPRARPASTRAPTYPHISPTRPRA
jgi:hypothetical protein